MSQKLPSQAANTSKGFLKKLFSKKINWNIIKTIRENINDRYYHQNNFFKALLMTKLRSEYGRQTQMEYFDGWEYDFHDHVVKISKFENNEDVTVKFHLFDEASYVTLNGPIHNHYEGVHNRLQRFPPVVTFVPVVFIEVKRKSGKVVFQVDYVDDSYPGSTKPNYTDPNDPQPYVLFNEEGKAMVEIASISFYDEKGNLGYTLKKTQIVPGFSEHWNQYLNEKGIDLKFYKKILSLGYRLDHHAYMKYLKKFFDYFPHKYEYDVEYIRSLKAQGKAIGPQDH